MIQTPFGGVIVFINFSTVVGAVVFRSASLNSTISAPTILNSLSDTIKSSWYLTCAIEVIFIYYSDPSPIKRVAHEIVLQTLDWIHRQRIPAVGQHVNLDISRGCRNLARILRELLKHPFGLCLCSFVSEGDAGVSRSF